MDRDEQRIFIRLNGKEHPYQASGGSNDNNDTTNTPNEADKNMTDLGNHEPPAKVIDLGKRRHERQKNDQPFWDDGNRERSPKLPFNRKKKKQRHERFFSLHSLPVGLIVAVLSAVIVGISFGFMVLTAFTGERSEGRPAISEPATVGVSNQAVQVPDLTLEVVQGGAFSQMQTGHQMVSSFQEAGFSAVLTERSDPFYMFIGVGENRSEAKALSERYQSLGYETYIKSYTVPVTSVQLEREEYAPFFHEGVQLLKELVTLSVKGIAEDGQVISDQNITTIVERYEDWQQQSEVFIESSEGTVRQASLSFVQALYTALTHLQTYYNEGSENEIPLWNVQQSLLQAMLAYEELIVELNL